MKKIILCLALMQLVFIGAEAKPRKAAQIRQLASEAINGQLVRHGRAPRHGDMTMLHKTNVISVLGYKDGGFAIVSNDDLMPEVLAIGDSQFSGTANENLRWWLNSIEMIGEEVVSTGKAPRKVNGPDPDLYPEYVDAIVSAKWGQEGPYNNLCPSNSSGRCLTGCVATALAQVLYTHRYPSTGHGERTIYWNSVPAYANFGETTYEYDKMLDTYTEGYTEEQANAVAVLNLHCGVAVNMDYGIDGSGAYSDQAADGMRKYFGFEDVNFQNREDFSDDEWMDMVYSELAGGHAMYYSGVDATGAGGHAFVCDGYDETGRVHINWGWYGSDDGFYNIDLLNPSYYKFSLYQDFIQGLYSPDDIAPGMDLISLDIETDHAGQLAELVGTDNLNVIRAITVKGQLNADDIAFLRMLASRSDMTDYGFIDDISRLSTIDLTNAEIEGNELADDAFRDCICLRRISLPRHLAAIGSHAFAGCEKLSSITSYTYDVPKTGLRCFEGVSAGKMSVRVIAGSTDYYCRNAQWKTIANKDNVVEFGTCLKAKNVRREQGKPNPVLGYVTIGQRVIGAPDIWTEADINSAPGTYPIHIERGTVEDREDIVLVPGVLTVKADATGIDEVTAEDETRSSAYTVAGVKAKDLDKGKVYIVDGKKVVR